MTHAFRVEDLSDVVQSIGNPSETLSISHQGWWIETALASITSDRAPLWLTLLPEDPEEAGLPVAIHTRTYGGVPIQTLEVGGGIVAYHPMWIALLRGQQHVSALLSAARQLGCTAVHFVDTPDNPATRAALELLDAVSSSQVDELASEVSPILDLGGYQDWQDYLSQRNKKTRYLIRKLESQLQETDDWSMTWFTQPGQVTDFFAHMCEIEAESWKAEAGTAVVPGNREHAYYSALLPVLAEHGALSANVMFMGSEPVAYNLCYSWQGVYGSMKTSFKTRYAEGSPGTTTYIHSLQRAFESGCTSYDFLGDATQHKQRWTKDSISHTSYLVLLPSMRTRLAIAAKKVAARLAKLRR